ncbi:hypothetical protein [Halovivax limisalsi]|uniref:hypothetical protein n=1 Tax=Halovivax limisalsi TaxID=1453760 RepID=UPI001FFD59E0|nr:hypothetical protein [Halovivax limisalsi]
MTEFDADSRVRCRRTLLAGIGGSGVAALAGCLALGDDGSDGREAIQPATEPIEREGTPAEFYYFLEENGITVESLERGGDVLYLTYRSSAENRPQSNDEIGIIYQVYRSGLILRGSNVTFLDCEIANPFDDQARGWSLDTDWIYEYDDGDDDESADGEAAESDDSDAENESDNQTAAGGTDPDLRKLWNLIQGTKVYEEET